MVFCSRQKWRDIENMKGVGGVGGWGYKKKQPKPPFPQLPAASMLQSRVCIDQKWIQSRKVCWSPDKMGWGSDSPLPLGFEKPKLYGQGFAAPIQPLLPARVSWLHHGIQSELFSWLTRTVDHHSQLCSFLHIWYKEKKKKNPYSSFAKTQAHTQ